MIPKTSSATARAVEQDPTDIQRDRQSNETRAERDEETLLICDDVV